MNGGGFVSYRRWSPPSRTAERIDASVQREMPRTVRFGWVDGLQLHRVREKEPELVSRMELELRDQEE